MRFKDNVIITCPVCVVSWDLDFDTPRCRDTEHVHRADIQSPQPRTGAEQYFAARANEPGFEASYDEARRKIDQVDKSHEACYSDTQTAEGENLNDHDMESRHTHRQDTTR